MRVILCQAEHVTASRPGRALFDDVSVTISSGDRVGLVGINGTGKSTLLRVLMGTETPESGAVRHGRDVRISMLDQQAELPPGTVRAAVQGGWEADAVLDRLGLTPFVDRDVADLSGGEAKRVSLAQALVTPCDLLILDEPTNHLDVEAIAWLEDHLSRHQGGLVLVSHDRHVLDRVCTRMIELDRGGAFVHDGDYESYLEARVARDEADKAATEVRRNLARRERAWLQRGAPARTRKSKHRVAKAEQLLDNLDTAAAAREGDLDLHFGTPRLGDKVIECHGISGGHPGAEALFANFDLLIDRRERLGIIGVNGSGKSTLLDIIAGVQSPLTGTIEVGPTVQLGYYDQRMRDIDDSLRVREVVFGQIDIDWAQAKLLERFWFDSDAQMAQVELLSGGERRRLQLLQVLATRPNVLFLDEPTNDLDLDTLRVLEDYLEGFPGAVIVVSHDRAFLERVVDDVIVLDPSAAGDGSMPVGRLPGGYEAWVEARRASQKARKLTAGKEAAGKEATGKPAGTPATSKSTPARSDQPAKRSHSTIRHQLKETEKAMAKLAKREASLEADLNESVGDHARLSEIGAALAETQAEVAAAEERWLELSEELENR